MRMLFVVLAIATLTGCGDGLREVPVSIYVSNVNVPGQLILRINDQDTEVTVSTYETEYFKYNVVVPSRESATGIDLSEQSVTVMVSFREVGGGSPTSRVPCTVARRAITRIRIEITGTAPYLYQDIYCETVY